MSIGIRHSITPGQCRAARALLDITQPQLAEAAGLGLSTIVDFEKSRRDVSRAAVHALQTALEKAGVRFIGKDGGGPAFDCLAESLRPDRKHLDLQAKKSAADAVTPSGKIWLRRGTGF